MRLTPFLVAGTGLVLGMSVACTQGSSSSSSSSSSTGGTGSSSSSSSGAGSSSSSGGTSTSSSSSSSSTGGSSGTASSRAGGSSGGSTSTATCPAAPFTLCNGIPAEATGRVINTTPGSGALGIAGLVTVGMTRAQVRAGIAEAEQFLPDNAFPLKVFYCAKRLVLSYGDRPDGQGMLAGTLTDDDVVTRVHTLDGFTGHTDTSLSHGSTVAAANTAYASDAHAQVMSTVLGGEEELYPARGVAIGHDGTHITWMAVHNAYNGTLTPTVANAPLRLGNNAIGSGQDIKASLLSGTSFSVVKTKLGTPDAEGFVNYSTTSGTTKFGYLSYGNLGLRIVGSLASGTTPLNDANAVQIYITPPYAGFDGNTLGLGAPRSEFDRLYGSPSTSTVNGATLYKYTVGGGAFPPAIAVGYSQDETCTDRAAVIVLNFVTF